MRLLPNLRTGDPWLVQGTAEDILTHNLKGLASSWFSDEDAVGALNQVTIEFLA